LTTRVTTLVKIGGTLLDAAESRERLAGEIAQAIEEGLEAVVVHGGGKQMTRFLAERGIESRFVNGLRVTTLEVLDAVLKVLAGSVNQELVAAFEAAGARAVGLSGMDGLITEARRMSDELGFVGQPVKSDTRLPALLIDNGYIPVVACVAGDRAGRFYNVNADQMAASIAAAFPAERLIFLTDVDGVRGQENSIVPTISTAECGELIASGIASGGMRAKLEAAAEALRAGVGEVVIAPGARAGVIRALIAGERIGTRLVSEVGASRHG
jgi:acetylglutamate kinase